MKKIIILFFLFITFFSNAQNKNAKAEIEVDGECNSCKARIEKNAISVKGVKFAQWSVDSHRLNVILDERKTSVKEVQKAIAKAGHNNRLPDGSNEIIASEEDYEKVSDCCKYRDENVVKNHH
ncbi:MAG: heavy-metal-associated domain-containing protein [Capnocytophaga sp.]|nr:heavy-metal-associated domain-containing protein [Capnocytophaga sp.]